MALVAYDNSDSSEYEDDQESVITASLVTKTDGNTNDLISITLANFHNTPKIMC